MKNKFIFDLDGTIVNTQIPFNSFVESELLKVHQNIIIKPEELASRFAGMATKKVFKETAPDCDIDFMFKEKWKMMYQLVEQKAPKCLPGMYELIVDLSKNDNQLSVASASPLLWVLACLNNARPYSDEHPFESRLIDIFDGKYFSAEGCKNNKPDPELLFIANDIFNHHSNGITYTIGDGRGDVLASISANFPVLYLSLNKEFDGHHLVTRFNSSLELSAYIRENLM
jgi:phosphoglycolate phosphatase-like HAD superfamily hydrolase